MEELKIWLVSQKITAFFKVLQYEMLGHGLKYLLTCLGKKKKVKVLNLTIVSYETQIFLQMFHAY